ncbi:TetR/AcrR family transcriptional regulator [Nonomuraea sp. NPDC049684]|uniref:TetR/AcrR family transcriptional regulator n=1 Tax=Nonomuraea sp. NPDC049684 TaxID=3364356 RepID=UPI003790CF83
MRTFWANGYESTSTRDLCEALGLDRSGVYNAFTNKRELFKRALTRYMDAIRVLLPGLVLNAIFLAGSALFAHLSVPAVIAMLGAGLAVLGVVSLLPELGRRAGARSSAPGPVDPCLAAFAGQERP